MADSKGTVTQMVGIMVPVPIGTERRSFLLGLYQGMQLGLQKPGFFSVDNHKQDDPKVIKPAVWTTYMEMPIEDTPCPCGKPTCWLIRWQEIEPLAATDLIPSSKKP